MKTSFIKINNISEINTSKITVQDLNNRYIDKDGKMYGLKYNRKNRKVSITRIIRTPAKSAEYFNQILKTQRREEILNQRASQEKITSADNSSLDQNKENPENEMHFDFHMFINKTIELMQSHKDRISGIMMNIKNSRMISDRDKINATQLNDLFRNLEIDGIVRIDKALTNYKEIKNYPRSLNYYIAKLDSKNRRILDELDSDARKMSFVYAAEMYYSIKTLYRTLFKILNDLNYFLTRISSGGSKDVTNAERQYFTDAKISVDNTIDETSKILTNIQKVEEFLNDIKNF